MKKIFKSIKKYWFNIFVIIIFAVMFIMISAIMNNVWREIFDLKYKKSDEIKILEDRISALEIDQVIDNIYRNDLIDPYSGNFQTVDESFAVSIKNIVEYGAGSKVSFAVLNKDSVMYDDLELKFQVRDRMATREFNVLANETYSFPYPISSGYSREGSIIFPEIKPDQIKAFKITVGNIMINYYTH